MMFWTALPLALALFASPQPPVPAPAEYLDLDFEAPECAGGWRTGAAAYDVAPDPAVAHTGRQSLRLSYQGKAAWTEASRAFGVATRDFPVAAAAGRKIRLSGFLRTEGVEHGYAGLWGRVDGKGDTVLAFDNMNDRGAHGTSPWTRYEIELAVPAEAQVIYFGALLAGDGTAWVDSLEVTVDGQPYREGAPPSPAQPSRAAQAWLRQHAVPFRTAEPGPDLADLRPLERAIGKAHLVGLGEATHGTREFFEMKHRLTRLLGSRMGFTLFAIEASMPDTEPLNRYVLTGEGDPAALVKGMGFWTWSTREVLDLVTWIREHNRAGKGTIQFRGFDMQNPKSAAKEVRAFVTKAEPAFSPKLEEAYAWTDKALSERMAPDDVRARLATAREVLAHLEAARGAGGEPTAREAGWAIQNARIVTQYLLMMGGERSRDQSMADNVEWLLGEMPKGSRAVLWAHNLHIQKSGSAMGNALAERFGADYLSVGFAFGQGRYRAVGAAGLAEHEARPAIPGSLESYLASSGLPRFILDLRHLPARSPAASWLAEPRPLREIGALKTSCGYMPIAAAKSHDLLIYFAEMHPAVGLP